MPPRELPGPSTVLALPTLGLLTLVALGCGTSPERPAGPSTTPDLELADLITGTEPIDGAFVLLDGQTGQLRYYQRERARRRYLPASTFKIPNTLIALETGVASGPDFPLPWDSSAAPTTRAAWARDQTLATAFRNSVYWYYQELARRVGEGRMRDWLARLDYGNQDMGGLDNFWLRGDLRISPEEQVRFLRRLHDGDLPVSARSRAIVRELMLLEDAGAYRLYGKTGSSDVTPTRENGWLVGFVEVGDGVHYYALNMEGETVWEDWPPGARADLVVRILERAGVVPQPDVAPGR